MYRGEWFVGMGGTVEVEPEKGSVESFSATGTKRAMLMAFPVFLALGAQW